MMVNLKKKDEIDLKKSQFLEWELMVNPDSQDKALIIFFRNLDGEKLGLQIVGDIKSVDLCNVINDEKIINAETGSKVPMVEYIPEVTKKKKKVSKKFLRNLFGDNNGK